MLCRHLLTARYAVDISSGVEINGLKDRTKIIKIAEILRSVK
ncbi:MAG: hypothetical protein PHN47_04720 [Clostridia bacterium]|jgi:phosphoribosylanthranilate isomerase|nr:hypothetical protein [Clostridia bacterium]MDD4571769.1 hypothetical protein [Clostridia bacterium]